MWAALFVGLGLMALGIARSLRGDRLRAEAWGARAERAEGTVRLPTDYFDLSLRQHVPYGPGDEKPPGKVIFKARDGREYALPAAYGADEGDKAAVLYDPESPSTATLDAGAPGRLGEHIARLAGGLLFMAAFAAFWMNR